MKVNIKNNLPEELKEFCAKNGIYVKIDQNYTATVRNLSDFIEYINSSFIDLDIFGEVLKQTSSITGNKELDELFIEHLNKIIKEVRSSVIGDSIEIKRNQGIRQATIVAIKEKEFLIEYEMPRGAVYLNVINNLKDPSYYSTITKKQALKKFAYECW
jgi:hypothetical protein